MGAQNNFITIKISTSLSKLQRQDSSQGWLEMKTKQYCRRRQGCLAEWIRQERFLPMPNVAALLAAVRKQVVSEWVAEYDNDAESCEQTDIGCEQNVSLLLGLWHYVNCLLNDEKTQWRNVVALCLKVILDCDKDGREQLHLSVKIWFFEHAYIVMNELHEFLLIIGLKPKQDWLSGRMLREMGWRIKLQLLLHSHAIFIITAISLNMP